MNILLIASLLLAPGGLIVESVGKGSPADTAGIRAGDVLVAWRALPGHELEDLPAGGALSLPFDLDYVEMEVAPRVPVVLSGLRDGQPIELRIEGGEWSARSRPVFGGDQSPTFEMAEAAAGRNDWTLVCWLAVRMAEQAPPEPDTEALDAFALAADTCAADSNPTTIALAQHALARAWQARRRYQDAEAVWREALGRWQAMAPHSLRLAAAAQGLGALFWERGLPKEAEPHLRLALSLREELAPDGLEVATSLHSLGLTAYWRSDVASASALLTRARAIRRRLASRSLLVAETLLSLAAATAGGDPVGAEDLLRQALASASGIEPDGVTVGTIEIELGNAAWLRGDVASAETHYRRALPIAERMAPQGRLLVRAVANLGNVAKARGDLEAAETLFRRAVALVRLHWPESLYTAGTMANFADVLAQRRRFVEAEDVYRSAIEVGEKAAPGSETVAFILHNAAESSQAQGDQARFERYVQRAMEIVERLPSTSFVTGPTYILRGDLALSQGRLGEAEDWYRKAIALTDRLPRSDESLAVGYRRLAKLEQKRGRAAEAADDYRRAVGALEALRVRLGGSGSGRLGFGVRHLDLYQEAIEALVEAGRPEEAFHYWERSRARGLLEMMAERDLVLDADLPDELRKRRRWLDAEYERTERALSKAPQKVEQDELRGRLGELEEQRQEMADEARQTSPRLASIAYPQPLEVEQARRSLDPDTALLAYSVGPQRMVLFVLAPRVEGEAKEVDALVIPQGSQVLGPRISAWRRLAERSVPPPAFFTEGRALYDVLVRPAEPLLSSARRLVICPDGPLHQLPFASLRRGRSYLVEWKPLTLVPSASVLDQLVQSRPAVPGPPSLVAFGDPHTPGLPRLAGSRREVDAIRSLFPASKAFLGAEATKPRMEAATRRYRYVHFAGHGVVDELLPLESALAFSPAPAETGPDSGLFRAWEIFERVRLDADLVTLSACRSAAGKELVGEGILGLTRAFHYAGARSVVASLWSVPDKSTPAFMRRFYGALKRGLAKDEALRRAQLASIRAGHHPIRWATFQLYGDWR